MTLAQRIAHSSLSPAHRQVADYVLDHPLKVAAMRVEELAEILGVSVPTINRFARALGFDGYAQFRADLVLGYEATLAPVEKLKSRPLETLRADEVFAETLLSVAANAEKTRASHNPAEIEAAVSRILTAPRIHILGYGASAWHGGLLERRLNLFCEDVRLLSSIEGASYAARSMHAVRPGDLVIAITFPRYMAESIRLARRMRLAGASVLALTDNASSPLMAEADMALFAHVESAYFATCEASIVTLIEALTVAVAQASGRSMQAASELAETVLPYLHGGHAASPRRDATQTAPSSDPS
nr:MurR/RpiR family transcriptional regulator [Allorhizobium sonneratiae]